MPLFYLFWRSVTGNYAYAGGVWALLAGSVVAMIQFFLGYFIEPGGFGFSRWLSGFVDIAVVPALIPILVYLILVVFRIFSGSINFANFALLWLIPVAAIKALSWSSLNDPVLLVLVPILWTDIAVGISFFIGIIMRGRKWLIFPALIAIFAIPLAAASSYWAFYAQKTSMGLLLLSAATLPMMVSMILAFIKAEDY